MASNGKYIRKKTKWLSTQVQVCSPGMFPRTLVVKVCAHRTINLFPYGCNHATEMYDQQSQTQSTTSNVSNNLKLA